jgi:putative transposase
MEAGMPRHLRSEVVVPGAPHHIILRGNNRRVLFSYSTCRTRFLLLLAEAVRVTGCIVHALVLMSNHLHMVATPEDAVMLARFVKRFAQRYAQQRNRTFEDTGKLFEERYYVKPITSEAQLAATTAYAELNPPRAGIVTEIGAYRWSTYGLHAGLEGSVPPVLRDIWTPSSWWSSLGATEEVRHERHRAFVEERSAHHELLGREVRELERISEERRRVRRPDGSYAAEERAAYTRISIRSKSP